MKYDISVRECNRYEYTATVKRDGMVGHSTGFCTSPRVAASSAKSDWRRRRRNARTMARLNSKKRSA